MNILITGACGFIGSHLVRALQEHRLFLIDDLSTGHKRNIKGLKYEKLFLNDYFDQNVLNEIFKSKIDTIIHLAAIASVQKCKEQPYESSIVNSSHVLGLVELAKRNKVSTFIFASSAAVYGDEKSLPKTENSQIKPISIYGIDKFAAEQYVINMSDQSFKGIACRFFNVFGPNQDPNSPYSGVLSIFANQIAKGLKKSVTIYGDGNQTRDFVYVDDVVSFLTFCAVGNVSSGVYNVATGIETSLNQVLDLLAKHYNVKIDVTYKNARKGDIKNSVANIQKVKESGFSDFLAFKDAFSKYLDSLG